MIIKEEEKPEPVWMNCQAPGKCEGTQAVLIMKFITKGVGRTFRYKCTTCGGHFHIQLGSSF